VSKERTLTAIDDIVVYDDDDVAFTIPIGEKIKGYFDGLFGGYVCVHSSGRKYLVFTHEVTVE
jgi:hypothetical protein